MGAIVQNEILGCPGDDVPNAWKAYEGDHLFHQYAKPNQHRFNPTVLPKHPKLQREGKVIKVFFPYPQSLGRLAARKLPTHSGIFILSKYLLPVNG